jgi:hypothetical protein
VLQQSEIAFFGGTFATAQTIFNQLFIVKVKVAYCFLQDKATSSNELALQELKN